MGVTAGAVGTGEELVDAVIARLAPRTGVKEINVTDEDEYFPPPRNIRELQAAIELAATTMTGGSLQAGPLMDDRALAASDVLAVFGPDPQETLRAERRGASTSPRARWGPSSTSSSSACWAASRLRRPVSAERTSSSSAVHPASHASTVMRSSRTVLAGAGGQPLREPLLDDRHARRRRSPRRRG